MMNIRVSAFLLICVSTNVHSGAPIHGLNDPDLIPGQYIVVLKDWQPREVMAAQAKVKSQKKVIREFNATLNGFVANMSTEQIEALAADPRVAYIEADRMVTYAATQSPATWGLDRLDQRDLPLNNTYTYNTEAANVNAYIIDTGIRASHFEFGGRVSSGFSSVRDGRGTDDCAGHGTHVAGTIGSATYGIAKQVNLHSVRVLGCNGFGTLSGTIAGVEWITDNHVAPAVVNMSIGAGRSISLDTAIRNSIATGVTYVVAAGNEADDACLYSPARVREAITVGASTSGDRRASFSNWGACVDIFAPGSRIHSTWSSSDTATLVTSGTSMASPHIAGLAALYLAANPGATPSEVQSAIIAAGSAGRLTNAGNGSPNLLAYSLFDQLDDSNGSGGEVSFCPPGSESYVGNLAGTNSVNYQPNGTYFFSRGGNLAGDLRGPETADFDLRLWRWTGSSWNIAARSAQAGSEESISYNGGAGYYIWEIVSRSGSGAYEFCITRP